MDVPTVTHDVNLLAVTPNSNTTIPFDSNLTLILSAPVTVGAGEIQILTADGTLVETIAVSDINKVTVSGTYVTLNPTRTLDKNTTYSLQIPEGAFLDSAGNASVAATGPTSWNFTTAENLPPSFTAFSSSVATTSLGTEVELTLLDLLSSGNATDSDGVVGAFIVASVNTGTLRIGGSADTATDFDATSNNTINASNFAYWTPAANTNYGGFETFVVRARDNDGAESANLVQAQVDVAVFVTDTSPAVNALSIATNSNISLTFSSNMDQSTFNTATSFNVDGSVTGLISAGSFSGDGTPTITFNPDNDFKAGEVITVTLTKSIKNSTGVTLKNSYTYAFRVAAIGGGEFSAESVITTSTDQAYSVAAADLDGDGDLDVLSGSSADNKVAWYENTDGQGSFGPQQLISAEINRFSAFSVTAADLDGDGDMDVLTTSGSGPNRIAWYENTNGQGSFGPRQMINAAQSGYSAMAVDLDGDGYLDVLSATWPDDRVAWYKNTNGEGSFGSRTTISILADSVSSVTAADVDGDGDMDVLSASAGEDNIAWYENTDGQGSFGPQQVISTLVDVAISVTAADMDGDGDMDVLSASAFDDKIAWYENTDGRGSFGSQQVVSSETDFATSVTVADMDGDGDLDVLSASQDDDKIAWYENTDGQGNFGSQQVISALANGAQSVIAADLDGDGDLDILSASYFDDKVAWYENKSPAPSITSPVSAVTVNTPHINLTGNAVAGATINVYSDADDNGLIDGIDTIVASQTLSGSATTFSISTPLTADQANNFMVRAVVNGSLSSLGDVPTVTQIMLPMAIPNDDTSLMFDGSLTLTLSETVTAGTGDIQIFTSDGTLVETIDVTDSDKVVVNGNTFTLNPASTLDRNTTYYVLVSAGAFIDSDGNASLAITGPNSWTFTVAQNSKIAPITVIIQWLVDDDL
jgi:hypothetical protein